MNDSYFDDAKIIGWCPCGTGISEGYEHVVVDDDYYCDIFCVFDHLVRKEYNVKEEY